MCDGGISAIAVAGLVLSAVGTGVSAYAAYENVQSQNRAADYNAKMQNRNAEIANNQATDAIARGDIAEKQHRLQVSQMVGTQRAGYGSSGLLVDEGTPGMVTEDTRGFGTLDALTIRRNAAVEAADLQNRAGGYAAQGSLFSSSKSNAALPLAGSLLSGASGLASSTYSAQRAGAFG